MQFTQEIATMKNRDFHRMCLFLLSLPYYLQLYCLPDNLLHNEQELLMRTAGGDETAFAALYQQHWADCYTTAFRILQQEQLAEDIVQEVFIRLWERRTEFAITSLQAYLQKAVRNRVLNAIRDQKTDDRFYERLAIITSDLLEENPVFLRENEQLLQQVIGSLPADCQETFRLSRVQQLTYKEIALQLHISEKTVEKRISRALQHIRANYSYYMLLVVAAGVRGF